LTFWTIFFFSIWVWREHLEFMNHDVLLRTCNRIQTIGGFGIPLTKPMGLQI
jgi:hypothetical protein